MKILMKLYNIKFIYQIIYRILLGYYNIGLAMLGRMSNELLAKVTTEWPPINATRQPG